MRKPILALALLALLLTGAPAQAAGPEPLTTGDLAAFYQTATGYAPDPGYFGVYSIQPVGDTLYLGFGTARPAEYDGALLARLAVGEGLDGNGLTALAQLDEQGFVDMTLADDKLYIPGADPTDDWTLGNLYVHDLATAQTTKLRTLPNTIHAWQTRVAADGNLRVTVGRYLPEQGAWPYAGGILTSADGGQTWTAEWSAALGAHRTYDLIEGTQQDVALVDDADFSGCQLATRPRGGGAWTRGAAWVMCRLRLASDPAGRRALAVGIDGRSLIVAGAEQRIPLPFAVEPWAYHWSAVVERTLYVLAADGRVMATRDLRTWREVAQFNAPLVSVADWPAAGALVVATRGAQAGLYRVARP